MAAISGDKINWDKIDWYKDITSRINGSIYDAMLGRNSASPYSGTIKENCIQGMRSNYILFDDPINEHNQESSMPTKLSEPPKKDYNTIAVRFIYGTNLHKAYTYKIRKGAKVVLGQEVVVPSTEVNGGPEFQQKSVAVVVAIHKTPQDTGPYNYLFVSEKVAQL